MNKIIKSSRFTMNCMYFTFKLMESNEKTVIEAEK